ncbi:MAG: four helix bundle protein [Fimbriimonadaceae bacterium]
MGENQNPAHRPIEELDLFVLFEQVADWVWDQVEMWKPSHQATIGHQLIRAADSVGANLVEGDRRYGDADGINFFIIAKASARETRLWLRRALKRALVETDEAAQQIDKLTRATKLLNLLITYRRQRGKRPNVAREVRATYNGSSDPFVGADV